MLAFLILFSPIDSSNSLSLTLLAFTEILFYSSYHVTSSKVSICFSLYLLSHLFSILACVWIFICFRCSFFCLLLFLFLSACKKRFDWHLKIHVGFIILITKLMMINLNSIIDLAFFYYFFSSLFHLFTFYSSFFVSPRFLRLTILTRFTTLPFIRLFILTPTLNHLHLSIPTRLLLNLIPLFHHFSQISLAFYYPINFILTLVNLLIPLQRHHLFINNHPNQFHLNLQMSFLNFILPIHFILLRLTIILALLRQISFAIPSFLFFPIISLIIVSF